MNKGVNNVYIGLGDVLNNKIENNQYVSRDNDFMNFGNIYREKLYKKVGDSGYKCKRDSDCLYNMKCLPSTDNKDNKNNNQNVCRDWGIPIYQNVEEKVYKVQNDNRDNKNIINREYFSSNNSNNSNSNDNNIIEKFKSDIELQKELESSKKILNESSNKLSSQLLSSPFLQKSEKSEKSEKSVDNKNNKNDNLEYVDYHLSNGINNNKKNIITNFSQRYSSKYPKRTV